MGAILGIALCLVVIVFVIFIIGLVMYNSLIRKKNEVNNAFASIDTLLKKRYDLIPNLVASVQQYMKHEQGTLTQITEMRAKAMSGNLTPDQRIELETKLTKTLGGIMVAVENYPDLKANTNFLQLQAALNEVEEQISAARRAYNAAVTDLNNAIEMFPSNMMASMMKLQKRTLFEISEEERKNVNVKNLFNQ
ncbi:MAG: LemA family protein [bacterium]|nr:LemA family protein [bacterium]